MSGIHDFEHSTVLFKDGLGSLVYVPVRIVLDIDLKNWRLRILL